MIERPEETKNRKNSTTKQGKTGDNITPEELAIVKRLVAEAKARDALEKDAIYQRNKRAEKSSIKKHIEEIERANAILEADNGQVFKVAKEANTGYPTKEGKQCKIGKIYLSSEWIGAAVMCSTIWKSGEKIPTGTAKTKPEIIRNEWNPTEVITIIKRNVIKHNAGRRPGFIGYVTIPREWIGRDVLIRRIDSQTTGAEQEPQGPTPAPTQATQDQTITGAE